MAFQFITKCRFGTAARAAPGPLGPHRLTSPSFQRLGFLRLPCFPRQSLFLASLTVASLGERETLNVSATALLGLRPPPAQRRAFSASLIHGKLA